VLPAAALSVAPLAVVVVAVELLEQACEVDAFEQAHEL